MTTIAAEEPYSHTACVSQTLVEAWLKKNEDYTNNFIIEWVKYHPELHLALFEHNPCFSIPKALKLQTAGDAVNSTSSKDSGVDFQPELSGTSFTKIANYHLEPTVEPESLLEERLSSLKIKPELNTKLQVHRMETLRADRLEAMLNMSGFLHSKIFMPHDIVSRVMHSAQQFLKCTLVSLLLKEPLLTFDSLQSGNFVDQSQAFCVANKCLDSIPRKVEEMYVPQLFKMTELIQQRGTTFEIDNENDIICVCLRGTWGTVVGFLVMMYSKEEIKSLTDSSLTYLQIFSQICGMAIENSLYVTSAMMKPDRTETEPQEIPETQSVRSKSCDSRQQTYSIGDVNDLDTDDEIDDLLLALGYRSYSCPQLKCYY